MYQLLYRFVFHCETQSEENQNPIIKQNLFPVNSPWNNCFYSSVSKINRLRLHLFVLYRMNGLKYYWFYAIQMRKSLEMKFCLLIWKLRNSSTWSNTLWPMIIMRQFTRWNKETSWMKAASACTICTYNILFPFKWNSCFDCPFQLFKWVNEIKEKNK